MSTNTVFNLSDNDCRMFAIDTIASPHQAMLRSSAYTVKVQYSSLAKTIQSICQRGGKILNVRSLSVLMPNIQAEAKTAPIQAQLLPPLAEVMETSAVVAEHIPVVEQIAPLPAVLETAVVVEAHPPVVEQIPPSPQATKKVEHSKTNSRRQSKSKKR